jgi:hypothetical protein
VRGGGERTHRRSSGVAATRSGRRRGVLWLHGHGIRRGDLREWRGLTQEVATAQGVRALAQ